MQVEIETVCPRVHERFQPVWTRPILLLHAGGIDEQLHAQIAPDFFLSLRLRQPSLRQQVVGLYPVEIVLGLRVDQCEHRVGVGLAMHMRDPPVVARDRDAARPGFPGGNFGCGCDWPAFTRLRATDQGD